MLSVADIQFLIWFVCIGFYGILTIVGYLMPNACLHIYIEHIWSENIFWR